jgi:cell division protein FtsQ
MSKTSDSRPSRLITQSPARPARSRLVKPGRLSPGGNRNSYRGGRKEPKKRWWGRGRNSYRRSPLPKPKRSWWRPVLIAFGLIGMGGLCLGLVVVYHQLLTSPLFCIKDINNIEIEGTRRLTREAILRQAKLDPALSLLAIRPGQVERALLAHPWIAKAEMTRKWPHRLHLQIQERDPLALVQMGEELYYVDRQGNLFNPLSPGDPHNFPVLTGLTQEHFVQVEGALAEPLAQAFQLLDVLKGAAPPLNLENVSEIHVDLERGFTIYVNGLSAGLELGFRDYSEKMQKFAQIWPALAQKGYQGRVGRINLDYPHRVLVTVKGMEEK